VLTRGANAEFRVAATSDVPVSYQWRKAGALLNGESNSTLILNSVQPADSGSFDARVWNWYGAVTSQVATLAIRDLDWGDAVEPPFPTTLSSDGARHVIVPGFHLGSSVDGERDGQPSADANADDVFEPGGMGVALSAPMRPGQTTQCRVVASSNGFLNAWVDYDRDGSWAHPGEHLISARMLVAGTNLIDLVVPPGASLGTMATRFRLSTVGALLPTGLAPDGEVEDYLFQLSPVADLQIGQSASSSSVAVGAEVTFTVSLTNAGPSPATSVTVVAPISPLSTFVSFNSGQGSCAFEENTLTCSLGAIGTGQVVSLTYRVSAGPGTNQSIVTAAGNEFDPLAGNNIAFSSFVGVIALPLRANGEATILPEFEPGPGTVYPLAITVSGQTSIIEKVTVTLHNVNHEWPDDLDVLLVGPNGSRVLLMSDCGLDNRLNDVTLTFDDQSSVSLPNSDPPIVTGVYKPTNFDRLSDAFALPAPPEPYVTNLSVFKGVSPNGTWSLYVMDDSPENAGFIADGWSLQLTVSDLISDLTLAANGPLETLEIGDTAIYQISITNRGPSPASAVVRDVLPPGFSFLNATASQGSCTHAGGVVSCSLGTLAPGGAVVLRSCVDDRGDPDDGWRVLEYCFGHNATV
jgi:uncharacterized repeat protein (TIGR01451 family)